EGPLYDSILVIDMNQNRRKHCSTQTEKFRVQVGSRLAKVIIHCRNDGPDLREVLGTGRSGPRSRPPHLGIESGPDSASHFICVQVNKCLAYWPGHAQSTAQLVR